MKRLPLLLTLVALGLYLALPVERFFSDSQYLLGRVEAGAPPYYNVAYVPLGQLVDLALGGWLGTERALEVLSALCVAGAVGLTAGLARRLGCGAVGTTSAATLLALAPGAVFFAGVIEVHAVQLLGAAAALRLAVVAGDRRGAGAWLAFALAAALALVTHLSHALFLPGLVVLAWARRLDPGDPRDVGGMLTGAPSERRGLTLGLAGVPWLLGLAILAVVAGVWLATSDFATWSVHPALQWLGTLVVFGERFLASLGERGAYPPAEALAYLRVELLAPLALLVVGLAAGALTALLPEEPAGPARRRFARRALLACLPALLVLPQGGVHERGGYFLTLAPLLALLTGLLVDRAARAATPRPVARALVQVAVLLAVLVQAFLAHGERRDFRASGPDARAWASAAALEARPGDSALVSSLARFFALAAAEPGMHVRDLARDLAMEPDAKREEMLGRVLAGRLGDARYPGDLWLDGALLPTWPAAPAADAPAWQHRLFEHLTASPVPVEVVGEPPTRLLRVVRRQL